MNQFENPVRLVKELKGAALSILVLLGWSNTPVSQRWLEVHSGYSDKPVSKALYYLREQGFVRKASGGWLLARDGVQLPLAVNQIEEGGSETTPLPDGDELTEEVETINKDDAYCQLQPVDNGSAEAELGSLEETQTAEVSCESRKNSGKSRKNSDSGLVSYLINTDSLNDNNLTNKLTNADGVGKIPDSGARIVARSLASHGIRLNKRTRKLLGQISCDDVEIVARELEADGKGGETGLMIVRLEQRAVLQKQEPNEWRSLSQPSVPGDRPGSYYRQSLINFGLLEPDDGPPESGFDPDEGWDGFDD